MPSKNFGLDAEAVALVTDWPSAVSSPSLPQVSATCSSATVLRLPTSVARAPPSGTGRRPVPPPVSGEVLGRSSASSATTLCQPVNAMGGPAAAPAAPGPRTSVNELRKRTPPRGLSGEVCGRGVSVALLEASSSLSGSVVERFGSSSGALSSASGLFSGISSAAGTGGGSLYSM